LGAHPSWCDQCVQIDHRQKFLQELPPGLEEAARIDGCTELGLLWRIVLPLSKPVLATFALFYAVGHWNKFFSALLYINDPAKWPLQVMLRKIVLLSQAAAGNMNEMDPNFVLPPEQSIKMAVIVVETVAHSAFLRTGALL
jgi:putative aldouronate transport system permease protein